MGNHRNYKGSATAVDLNENEGYGYYCFSVDYEGNERPFEIYIISEYGYLVISNINVNKFIPGQHY